MTATMKSTTVSSNPEPQKPKKKFNWKKTLEILLLVISSVKEISKKK